jgi:hypothetical protein
VLFVRHGYARTAIGCVAYEWRLVRSCLLYKYFIFYSARIFFYKSHGNTKSTYTYLFLSFQNNLLPNKNLRHDSRRRKRKTGFNSFYLIIDVPSNSVDTKFRDTKFREISHQKLISYFAKFLFYFAKFRDRIS